MENIRKITQDLCYIGCQDRRINLFENQYPVESVSYNAYLLNDTETVLFNTVDKNFSIPFFKNLTAALGGKPLNYLMVNHLEPDHSALIADVVAKYPDVKIICNQKTKQMLYQFFDFTKDIENNFLIVKENDIVEIGRHKFTFIMAPMVHWPEVMVTYDLVDKILFSADAFGSFGALDGNIIDSETEIDDKIGEYRRYYTNIVGKYGFQVNNLLVKAQNLDIKMICPLHGLILKDNIAKIAALYTKWANYEPETKSALLVYASVYDSTKEAVEELAGLLAQNGVKNIKIYDVSKTHRSFILADAFKYSHIVLASTTYNNGLFPTMENFVRELSAHNLQKRTFAIVENGSWAPKAGSLIKEMVSSLPETKIIENTITIKSSCKQEEALQLVELAKLISEDIK